MADEIKAKVEEAVGPLRAQIAELKANRNFTAPIIDLPNSLGARRMQ